MGKKTNASAQTALATIAKASAESTIAANIEAMAAQDAVTESTESVFDWAAVEKADRIALAEASAAVQDYHRRKPENGTPEYSVWHGEGDELFAKLDAARIAHDFSYGEWWKRHLDQPTESIDSTVQTDSTAVTVASTNAAIAAMGMADVSAIIDATQTVKADTKTFVTSSKNYIRCGEVLSVAVALMHLTNHHNKESLRQVLVKAKGLSTPLRNALRVIIPCLTYEKGIVMYDLESGHVDVVTLDNGKQSVRPRIDFDALDVLMFQARRVMLTPRDQWRMIDIVSESWKATFPTLDKVELLKDDVQAWREKQIKSMVKAGVDESAARAFVSNQHPVRKA